MFWINCTAFQKLVVLTSIINMGGLENSPNMFLFSNFCSTGWRNLRFSEDHMVTFGVGIICFVPFPKKRQITDSNFGNTFSIFLMHSLIGHSQKIAQIPVRLDIYIRGVTRPGVKGGLGGAPLRHSEARPAMIHANATVRCWVAQKLPKH